MTARANLDESRQALAANDIDAARVALVKIRANDPTPIPVAGSAPSPTVPPSGTVASESQAVNINEALRLELVAAKEHAPLHNPVEGDVGRRQDRAIEFGGVCPIRNCGHDVGGQVIQPNEPREISR